MKKVKHQSKRKIEDILRSADDHPITFDEVENDEIGGDLQINDEIEDVISEEDVKEEKQEIIEDVGVEEVVEELEAEPEMVDVVEVKDEDVLLEEEQEDTEKTSGFWGMFKKQVIDEDVNIVNEPVKKVKEEKVSMSYNTKQSSYTSDTTAVISASMVITGDIEIETSLVISGKIIGNVNCKDSFESKNGGTVEGNLSALSAEFVGGTVKGNVTVDERIVIDEETVIEGDVKAKDLVISGKVNGEIKAENTVRLTSSAVIKGDLYASSISIESGAKLDGRFVVQE